MGTITREFKRYRNNTEATSSTTTLNLSFKLIQTSETDDTYLFNSIPYYSNVTKANIKMYAKANSSALTQVSAFIGKTGTITNGSANNAYSNKLYNTSTQSISTSYKWMTFTGFESYFDTSPGSLGLTKDRLICVRFYATASKTWYRSNFSIELTYNTPTVTISASGSNGSVSGNKTIDILEHGVNYSTTLTAVPNSGYKFVKWSDGATANPRTFTYNDSSIGQNSTTVTCNAVFEPLTYTISTSAGTGGTITASKTVNYGSSQNITATANTGYVIDTFKVDGTTISAATGKDTYTYSFSNVTAAHTVSVTYKLTAQPPEFTSVHMYYGNEQISETHKVLVGQGFIIEVEVQ